MTWTRLDAALARLDEVVSQVEQEMKAGTEQPRPDGQQEHATTEDGDGSSA